MTTQEFFQLKARTAKATRIATEMRRRSCSFDAAVAGLGITASADTKVMAVVIANSLELLGVSA